MSDSAPSEQTPDATDPSRAGRVNVTLGPVPAPGGPGTPPPAAAPRPAKAEPPAPPQRPPVLQALIDLRADVRDLRKGIDMVVARVGDDTEATKTTAESLTELKSAVQTLESYVSLGFFDRVRTTLQDISEQDPRPAAMQAQVSGLQRTVSRLVILQVISLAAVALLVMADTNALGKLERGAETVLESVRPVWGPVVDYLDGDAAPTLDSLRNDAEATPNKP